MVMNTYQTQLHWKEKKWSHGNMDSCHCQEDTITELMLITVFCFIFDWKAIENFVTVVGQSAWVLN